MLRARRRRPRRRRKGLHRGRVRPRPASTRRRPVPDALPQTPLRCPALRHRRLPEPRIRRVTVFGLRPPDTPRPGRPMRRHRMRPAGDLPRMVHDALRAPATRNSAEYPCHPQGGWQRSTRTATDASTSRGSSSPSTATSWKASWDGRCAPERPSTIATACATTTPPPTRAVDRAPARGAACRRPARLGGHLQRPGHRDARDDRRRTQPRKRQAELPGEPWLPEAVTPASYKVKAVALDLARGTAVPASEIEAVGRVNNGYRIVAWNKRGIGLHRLVMAAHLGRPLGRHEQVHHRNGLRGDNRIANLRAVGDPTPSLTVSASMTSSPGSRPPTQTRCATSSQPDPTPLPSARGCPGRGAPQ